MQDITCYRNHLKADHERKCCLAGPTAIRHVSLGGSFRTSRRRRPRTTFLAPTVPTTPTGVCWKLLSWDRSYSPGTLLSRPTVSSVGQLPQGPDGSHSSGTLLSRPSVSSVGQLLGPDATYYPGTLLSRPTVSSVWTIPTGA